MEGKQGRFVNKTPSYSDSYKPTIGVDTLKTDIDLEECKATITFWDTAGQEKLSSLAASYYKGCDGCALVYDVTDEESFRQLEYWRQELLKSVNTDFPIVLMGNKSDQLDESKVNL